MIESKNIRISNYRNEFSITLLLIMFFFGLIVILKESKANNHTPLIVYSICSLIFAGLIFFLIKVVKIAYFNKTNSEIVIKTLWSKKSVLLNPKKQQVELILSHAFSNQLKIISDKKTYYTYISFKKRALVKQFINNIHSQNE
jgi:hypothetical protein